jgi:hypothetical protein
MIAVLHLPFPRHHREVALISNSAETVVHTFALRYLITGAFTGYVASAQLVRAASGILLY